MSKESYSRQLEYMTYIADLTKNYNVNSTFRLLDNGQYKLEFECEYFYFAIDFREFDSYFLDSLNTDLKAILVNVEEENLKEFISKMINYKGEY